MPVLRFKESRLLDLLPGHDLPEVEEALFNLKAEVEREDGYVYVELNPDRPDMYIGEGVARAVKGYLGEELGYKRPPTVDGEVTVSAGEVPVRPYIAAAVVFNVNVDEDFLEELIQFQEKLHDTLGRRRRKAAIGFHDLDKLRRLGSSVEYRMLPVEGVSFTPLGAGRAMKASEVLEATEQGRRYGGIALAEGRHPFLLAGGEVIAMPPVINSEATRVEPGTQHLFIDVTGTDAALVSRILDIIVSDLAERPGAIVGTVKVSGAEGEEAYPRLETRDYELSVSWVNGLLGLDLDSAQVEELLERARMNAEALSGDLVGVEVPPYRVDVLGEVDLAEDIAMMYGYHSIQPRYEPPPLRGRLTDGTRLARKARLLLVGLGFTEVMRLTLTSPRAVEALGLSGEAVRIVNPVQEEYSVLRPSLAATLLPLLAENQHAPKPVKVFEVGEVVRRTRQGIEEDTHLALAVMDNKASLEDIQAPVYSLLRILGVPFQPRRADDPLYIKGRAAALDSPGTGEIGRLGEVHPEKLEALGLTYPVAYAELSLSRILQALKTKQQPGSASQA